MRTSQGTVPRNLLLTYCRDVFIAGRTIVWNWLAGGLFGQKPESTLRLWFCWRSHAYRLGRSFQMWWWIRGQAVQVSLDRWFYGTFCFFLVSDVDTERHLNASSGPLCWDPTLRSLWPHWEDAWIPPTARTQNLNALSFSFLKIFPYFREAKSSGYLESSVH